MPSTNPFTEEGRTRFRNFQRRLLGYLGVWLGLGLTAGLALFWYHTRGNFGPLQQLYLKQFAVASVKSSLFKTSASTYILLVRTVTDRATKKEVTLGCTDAQAYPLRDENGRVLRDNTGYFFKLHPGLEARYLYWKRSKIKDRDMAAWLRQNIYEETSFMGLFQPSFILGVVVFISGVGGTVLVDRRVNRRYEEGALVRGTISLMPKQYEKNKRRRRGLGIPIHIYQEKV